MNVLIVEDDPAAARLLRQAVIEAGYRAEIAANGELGLRSARSGGFDLIVLDVMLPGMDGLTVCRTLRADGNRTPVLMLTARDTTDEKVAGLDSGADDYVVKPFSLAELLARARALVRRSAGTAGGPLAVLRIADLTVNPASREAHRGGRPISLSATEYKLLEHLMRHVGQVLTRSALVDHIWQYDFGGNDNVLDVYISYLRTKIDKGQSVPLIQTVRGVGYRICDPAVETS